MPILKCSPKSKIKIIKIKCDVTQMSSSSSGFIWHFVYKCKSRQKKEDSKKLHLKCAIKLKWYQYLIYFWFEFYVCRIPLKCTESVIKTTFDIHPHMYVQPFPKPLHQKGIIVKKIDEIRHQYLVRVPSIHLSYRRRKRKGIKIIIKSIKNPLRRREWTTTVITHIIQCHHHHKHQFLVAQRYNRQATQ